MEQTVQNDPAKTINRLWIWMGSLLGLALLSEILGWFNDFTELTPAHDNVDLLLFCITGGVGLISGGIAVVLSKNMVLWRRVGITFSCVLLGLLAGFMTSYNTANLIEGFLDFPPTNTRTYSALARISRAYQTHGKGESWHIQTMPLWSDLDITADDYNFMLAHRPDGDRSRDPDEISSKGYFCAQVTATGRQRTAYHACWRPQIAKRCRHYLSALKQQLHTLIQTTPTA